MLTSIPDEFPRLTSRLHFIELTSDHLKNLEIWHCLSVFESYVYGVISQYCRINENLAKMKDSFTSIPHTYSSAQVRLDIYYYILTWDKLRKVFEKLKEQINKVFKDSNDLPIDFKNDYRQIRTSIEHLLVEFKISIRNEYEHPTLQPKKAGNILEWGSLIQDGQGNIKVHVGNEEHAIVRKEHIDRMFSFWITLIDIFVKYFTDKPLSFELIKVKEHIEKNIDMIISTYKQYRDENQDEDANQILHQVLISEIYLTREGIPLGQDTKDKLYSILMTGREAN